MLWNVTGNRNSGCKGTRDTLGREENLLIGHVGAKGRQVTVNKEMEMLRAAESAILPMTGT